MIAFERPLAACAENAGIKVPADLENYNPEDYVHWHIYRMTQLGAPLPYPSAHWDNAVVIAKLSEEQAKTVTFRDLEELGCMWGFPIP